MSWVVLVSSPILHQEGSILLSHLVLDREAGLTHRLNRPHKIREQCTVQSLLHAV